MDRYVMTLVVMICIGAPVRAQAGSLDAAFGTGGLVATPLPAAAFVNGVAVQADGRIVAVGRDEDPGTGVRRWVMMRYDSSGNLDPTFGGTGIIRPFPNDFSEAGDVVVDAMGRIVVLGSADTGQTLDAVTLRLLPADGSLDPTFGTGGVVATNFPRKGQPAQWLDWGQSIEIQPDGKIVIAAAIRDPKTSKRYLALARYLDDGSLDRDPVTGFGELDGSSRAGLLTDPSVTEPAAGSGFTVSLALQADGKVVAGAGYVALQGWILRRYSENGELDTGFGSGGEIRDVPGRSTTFLWDVVTQGNRVLGVGRGADGASALLYLIVGYDLTGQPDPTFGVNGIAQTGLTLEHQALAAVTLPDERIVATGNFVPSGGQAAFMAFRFGPDGFPDTTFGTNGMSELGDAGASGQLARTIAVDPASGDYVVAGFVNDVVGSQPLVARYLGGGAPLPAAPTQLSATAASSSVIDLTWVDNAGDEDGFEVESSFDGVAWSLLATLPADTTAFSDGGLAANTTVSYRVRAFSAAGASAWSNVAQATTLPDAPPAAPSALVATAVSSSEIQLGWTDNAGDESGFEIERSLDGASWSALASLPADATDYDDTGLDAETTYHYRVRAINVVGASAWSNAASATTPPAPVGVTVSAIAPDLIQAGTTITNVVISGEGFATGATVTFENGAGPAPSASNIDVQDPTTIVCTISASNGGPPGTRVWDLRVTNPDSATGVLPGGFTVEK